MPDQARLATDRPLLQLDMTNLPLCEGSFAATWCIAALQHILKLEAPATLSDMRRVLWPGGYVALSMQEGEGEEWNAGHVDGVLRFFARYSAGEMASLLSDAGFRILQQEREHAGRWWLRYLAQLVD